MGTSLEPCINKRNNKDLKRKTRPQNQYLRTIFALKANINMTL